MYEKLCMERSKLVFGSLALALIVFAGAIFSQMLQPGLPIYTASVKAKLSMGEAPLEIVLIEDFQCRNCMAFSQKAIPQIQKEYVKNGKVKFTLIPVSFLPGSQAVGNAILEVQRQAPSQVFAYLEKVLRQYEADDLRPIDLVQIAGRLEGVDLAALQEAIVEERHTRALEKNFQWAKGVMGGRFRTPALYINGAPGSTFSYEAIQEQIEQVLRNK
jgi:protein-disulfide isomerase